MKTAGRSHSALEPFLEVGEGTTVAHGLHVDTITLDLALSLKSLEIGVNELGEAVFSGDENLLSAGELELGTTQGLLGESDVLRLCSDGDEDGTNVDTGGLAEGLTVSVTHTGLESISTGAGEHLVDADDVPWVNSDTDMETFLSSVGLHVFVSGNTGGFEGFR